MFVNYFPNYVILLISYSTITQKTFLIDVCWGKFPIGMQYSYIIDFIIKLGMSLTQ